MTRIVEQTLMQGPRPYEREFPDSCLGTGSSFINGAKVCLVFGELLAELLAPARACVSLVSLSVCLSACVFLSLSLSLCMHVCMLCKICNVMQCNVMERNVT